MLLSCSLSSKSHAPRLISDITCRIAGSNDLTQLCSVQETTKPYHKVATACTLFLNKVRVRLYFRAYAEGGVDRHTTLAEGNPDLALQLRHRDMMRVRLQIRRLVTGMRQSTVAVQDSGVNIHECPEDSSYEHTCIRYAQASRQQIAAA